MLLSLHYSGTLTLQIAMPPRKQTKMALKPVPPTSYPVHHFIFVNIS
uniref:Uncharacterized protein n=1 Tax=Picea glauca TaxID=3330 RepID=A0A101LXA3_PICGL|nr:hypothetical protein ABT39_MTgene6048 [Picea glauca]